MAIAQAVTCDVCGKVKGSVNHWWMFTVANVLGVESEYLSFEAVPWIESESEWKRHACGQECLVKAMDRWMRSAICEPVKP